MYVTLRVAYNYNPQRHTSYNIGRERATQGYKQESWNILVLITCTAHIVSLHLDGIHNNGHDTYSIVAIMNRSS